MQKQISDLNAKMSLALSAPTTTYASYPGFGQWEMEALGAACPHAGL
jgi:hypothetical protein